MFGSVEESGLKLGRRGLKGGEIEWEEGRRGVDVDRGSRVNELVGVRKWLKRRVDFRRVLEFEMMWIRLRLGEEEGRVVWLIVS